MPRNKYRRAQEETKNRGALDRSQAALEVFETSLSSAEREDGLLLHKFEGLIGSQLDHFHGQKPREVPTTRIVLNSNVSRYIEDFQKAGVEMIGVKEQGPKYSRLSMIDPTQLASFYERIANSSLVQKYQNEIVEKISAEQLHTIGQLERERSRGQKYSLLTLLSDLSPTKLRQRATDLRNAAHPEQPKL